MNKSIMAITLAVVTAFAPAIAMAAVDSDVVNASASIAAAMSLETVIIQHQFPGPVDSTVTTMNFGALTANGFGGLDSSRFFTVYLTGHTQQAPYIISSTGTDMTNGTTTLPDGAQFLTPVYVASDNGGAGIPAGAVLGTAGTWVATNKTIYDSENANAQERTIQAVVGLRGDPALGAGNFVPANQPPGAYSAQVTFTVTT